MPQAVGAVGEYGRVLLAGRELDADLTSLVPAWDADLEAVAELFPLALSLKLHPASTGLPLEDDLPGDISGQAAGVVASEHLG